MQVSKKCIELLADFNKHKSEFNVLVADLQKIQYGVIDENKNSGLDYDNYWHKPLSNDMLNLVDAWKDKTFADDLFLTLNNDFKQIVENNHTQYSVQMIFPIFANNKLDAFVILFKTQENFDKIK